MKLIFIHGRKQENKDPIELRETWINAWEKGLEKSGKKINISEEKIFFPYYGDTLIDLLRDYETLLIEEEAFDSEYSYYNDLLAEFGRNAGVHIEEPDYVNFIPSIEEQRAFFGRTIKKIARFLNKDSAVVKLFFEHFLRDVFVYSRILKIKEEINKKVIGCFDNEECVVVGHSLGSVIGYNLLSVDNPFNVVKYITVGSPLGVETIKRNLDVPPRKSPNFKIKWLNAYDERDIVALTPLNEKNFNVIPAITNKEDVHNDVDKWHHGISGYLSDKEVALEIFQALE